jgi:hypothetical protein
VDDITRLIVEKLLHTPTEQLKTLGDPDTVGTYSEALTRLFALGEGDNPTEQQPSTERRRDDRRVEPFARPKNRSGN